MSGRARGTAQRRLLAEFIREISSQLARPPFVSISTVRTIFYLLGDFDQILVKAHISRGGNDDCGGRVKERELEK